MAATRWSMRPMLLRAHVEISTVKLANNKIKGIIHLDGCYRQSRPKDHAPETSYADSSQTGGFPYYGTITKEEVPRQSARSIHGDWHVSRCWSAPSERQQAGGERPHGSDHHWHL